MAWDFKKHAEDINSVRDGISVAVEERMKSERFRAELITNVSHDIKTPLTSIINYVDLLEKEDIESEKAQEYIAVLDRQSARLKKLLEDLIEASKASTGSIPVNMEECDASVLLAQVVGEFEDRIEKEGLELIVEGQDKPAMIMADGRHLWRIIDNLMANICKYSLSGSRVYITLETFGGMVTVTFKNISRSPLGASGDELMERFVRGDSSRNTEGSGLGLSIAQSLAALMDGNLEVMTDGDLFKAIVSFPTLDEGENS
ncbi:MAG: HAMP domain-containing histidine kinase [Clostridiales bacterium]|nr:HAMP domain-containing histidine kinase [Clostridiales bacterium]